MLVATLIPLSVEVSTGRHIVIDSRLTVGSQVALPTPQQHPELTPDVDTGM